MRQSASPQQPQPVSRFPSDRLGDAELVRAVAQGNPEAVGVVWDRYSPLIRRVLRANLGFDSEVEDLLQEVFVIFLRNVADLRAAGALRAFLVTVAVRVVLGELRRRRVRRWVTLSPTGELPDSPSSPDQWSVRDLDGSAALSAMVRLLERMPARRRIAFVLRNVEGLEFSDVAQALTISESTAKREVARARQTLFSRAKLMEPALWHYLSRFEGVSDA